MTRRRGPFSRLAAGCLIAALIGIGSPMALAAETADISGTVLRGDNQKPLVGVTVYLGNPSTGEVFRAEPTSDDGHYIVEGLVAGTYELAVESAGGLFVVNRPVQLDAGERRELHLALSPARSAATAPAVAPSKSGRAGVWNNPLTASLIIIGGAIAVGLLIDAATDDSPENPASPSF